MTAFAAVAAAITAFTLTPSATVARPTLRLLDAQPVVLRGTAFRPNERVKITVLQPTMTSRAIRAGAAGRFGARFAFSLGRCEDLEVRARGSRGSRATLELLAPDCAEP
jgi:hypothetical protein